MEKAVILAAGRGSRMRKTQNSTTITADQAKLAEAGIKAMVPVGRPFIDYVLSGIADAGYRQVCLIIGPDHNALQQHCLGYKSCRLAIHFAVQPRAIGTADAVAHAADFVGDDPFLLINADNFYPASALTGLRHAAGAAVAAFSPEGLCQGNISPERLRHFALLLPGSDGSLERVVEKPSDDLFKNPTHSVLVSMNCWRFNPAIFAACRSISLSPRNEYELTDAVTYAIQTLGEKFRILTINEPVLDLTSQNDIPEVARLLASHKVNL